jgi:hypothetical protein
MKVQTDWQKIWNARGAAAASAYRFHANNLPLGI